MWCVPGFFTVSGLRPIWLETKGSCSLSSVREPPILCFYYSSFTLTWLFIKKKKRHIFVVHKIFLFLPPKSICLPWAISRGLCLCGVSWGGQSQGQQWSFSERGPGSSWRIWTTPSCSRLEATPVLKYSLSAIVKKNKGLWFKWSHPSC